MEGKLKYFVNISHYVEVVLPAGADFDCSWLFHTVFAASVVPGGAAVRADDNLFVTFSVDAVDIVVAGDLAM